jgi:hypothetical protein
VGFSLPLSDGKPDPGPAVGRLNKQQPHQLAIQSDAGAEDKVILPPSLKARRPREEKPQRLNGQPRTALSPAVPKDTTTGRGSGTGQETHLSFSRSFVGLKRLLQGDTSQWQ